MKKILIAAGIIVIAAIVISKNSGNKNQGATTDNNIQNDAGKNSITDIKKEENAEGSEEKNKEGDQKENAEAPVKEFTMTSFFEMVDGKPRPQYSLKEINVKKGDHVKIKITVTKGMHDFKIDEYNIYADTQPNQEMTVDFIADKVGEFVYYCTKPMHRANGHWGTLKVTE